MALTGLIYNTAKENDREQWRRSLAEAGLTLVDGSFEEGATTNSTTDVVWHIAGGQCYSWGGTFPKAVSSGSTPASTGGVGLGAWVSSGDAHLRNDLISNEILNGTYPRVFDTVAELSISNNIKLGMLVTTKGYYSAGDGGGALYVIGMEPANGYTVIPCTGGLTAKIQVSDGTVDIRQTGAKPDGSGPVKATDGNYLYQNVAKAIQRQQTVNGDTWHLDKSVLEYTKAAPDTSTDNRAAIQYALSVAGTIVGTGSYKIKGKIELDSFKTVKANGLLHIYCDYVDPATSVYTDDIFTNSDHENGNAYISIIGGVVIEGNARYFSASEMLPIRVEDTYPNFYPGSGVKFDNVSFGKVEIIGLFGQYGVSVSAGFCYDIHDCLTMYNYDDGITFSMNNSPLRGAYDSKASTIKRCISLVNGFGAFASTGIELDDTTGFIKVSDCLCAGNSSGFDVHFHRSLDSNTELQRQQAGIVFEDCIAFENNCAPSLVTTDSSWVHNVGFRTSASYGNYGIIYVRCHSNGHWNNEYAFTGSSNMEKCSAVLIDCAARNPSSEYLSHYTIKATVYVKFGVSLTIRGGNYDGGLQTCVRSENAHSVNILDKCVLRRAMCFVDTTFHSSYASDVTGGLTIDSSVLKEHYTAATDRQGVRCTSGGFNIAITKNVMEAATVGLNVAYLYLYGSAGAKVRVQDNTCIRSGSTASQGRFLQILTPNTKLHETNNTVVNFDMDLHWTAATGSTIIRSGQILESTSNAIFPPI